MTFPMSMQTALKEWAVVCRALERGRQTLLLRKGGIREARRGFEVEHRQFLLFPTYLHQDPRMLKPEAHGDFEPRSVEPAEITLSLAAEVTDIIQLQSRRQMEAIDEQHVWTAPLIDMRFNYRPQNPLYLLLVRAYRLGRPMTAPNNPTYAGCKSWVPLRETIDTAGASLVLDDAAYEARRSEIAARVEAARSED